MITKKQFLEQIKEIVYVKERQTEIKLEELYDKVIQSLQKETNKEIEILKEKAWKYDNLCK